MFTEQGRVVGVGDSPSLPSPTSTTTTPGRSPETGIDLCTVTAYTIPTETPESDGTLDWNSTTLVLVELHAAGKRGIGFTYAAPAAAHVIEDALVSIVRGCDPMDIDRAWRQMIAAVRNLGRPGLAAEAISAVDIALWDLKAKLLGVPLATLLGRVRDRVPVYGSGGFTSYSVPLLRKELGDWVERDFRMVKMKVGRDPAHDRMRVGEARHAIGPDAELFVDANGAYSRKQALMFAEAFAEDGVTWFEEPVSSDDLDGLRLLRDRAPSGVEIAAGEYGYDPWYFRRMLEAQAVDVLQADATRCLGITGFLRVAALCEAFMVPLSSHTAPSIHVHPSCALDVVRHAEWFFDHVRIERMLFEGFREPVAGSLWPDPASPGLGLEFKRADAARFLVHASEQGDKS